MAKSKIHKIVKRNVKHFFIPHKGNKFHAHIFREVSVGIILFISVFLLGISIGRYYFLNRTVLGESISSSVLVDLTNESRVSSGKSPLLRNEKLEAAAYMKATDMSVKGYFSHKGPDGSSFWNWIKKAGYEYAFAGENLAVDFLTSQEVREGWLNSPKHKENLMANRFTEIGIATKEGILDGKTTVFVVQMFGTPSAKAESIVIEETKVTTSETVEKTEVKEEKRETTAATQLKGIPTQKQPQKDRDALTESASKPAENNVILHNDDNLIVVSNSDSKNIDKIKTEVEKDDNVNLVEYQKYSSYLDKFVYFFTNNLNYIYKIFGLIFAIILIISLVVEYERCHWKHIFYGSVSVVSMFVMFMINSLFL